MRLPLFIFLIITTSSLHAQFTLKRNAIYLEGGGNGIHGSVNFERQFSDHPGFGARIGAGFYYQNPLYPTIPAGINYLFQLRNERSFIEAGIGATWTPAEAFYLLKPKFPDKKSFVYIIPDIGYRRYTENGLFLKLAFTPAVSPGGFFPWFGVSAGKSF